MKRARISTENFNRLIETTKAFCATVSGRATSMYIRLEFYKEASEVIAVACDGYRLSVEHSIAECEEDFVVYIRSTIKLPKGDTAVIELEEKEVIIRCGGFVFGYKQPEGDFVDWNNVIPKREPSLRIGFNGDYLLSALQAAKKSAGGFRNPIILEFGSPLQPVLIRTNTNDIKMVLPVRIKE